jgi:hypothetical protein
MLAAAAWTLKALTVKGDLSTRGAAMSIAPPKNFGGVV